MEAFHTPTTSYQILPTLISVPTPLHLLSSSSKPAFLASPTLFSVGNIILSMCPGALQDPTERNTSECKIMHYISSLHLDKQMISQHSFWKRLCFRNMSWLLSPAVSASHKEALKEAHINRSAYCFQPLMSLAILWNSATALPSEAVATIRGRVPSTACHCNVRDPANHLSLARWMLCWPCFWSLPSSFKINMKNPLKTPFKIQLQWLQLFLVFYVSLSSLVLSLWSSVVSFRL